MYYSQQREIERKIDDLQSTIADLILSETAEKASLINEDYWATEELLKDAANELLDLGARKQLVELKEATGYGGREIDILDGNYIEESDNDYNEQQ